MVDLGGCAALGFHPSEFPRELGLKGSTGFQVWSNFVLQVPYSGLINIYSCTLIKSEISDFSPTINFYRGMAEMGCSGPNTKFCQIFDSTVLWCHTG